MDAHALAVLALAALGVPLLAEGKVTTIQGVPGSVYRYKVDAESSVEIAYPALTESAREPYRVEVSSTRARRERPVFVVVRQQRRILSWQLPLLVEAANPAAPHHFVEYLNTGRTLCNAMEVAGGGADGTASARLLDARANFTVTLTTFAEARVAAVWVTVRALPVRNYFVRTNATYTATFSPSEPMHYAYEFPDDDLTAVRLQVTSEDDICFTVSVQPHICPIYDLLDQITYQGKYQTVSKKGGLVIHRKDFGHAQRAAGFVIVFVAHADNYECDTDAAVPFARQARFRENRQISTVEFTVRASKKTGEYGVAIFSLLGVNLALCAVILLLTYLFYRLGRHYKGARGTGETVSRADSPVDSVLVDAIQNNPNPTLVDFVHQPRRNRRMALNYLWHITNIGIFYGLPVVQLMIFYQRAVDYSGDLDICYYNNQCAHPLYFNDFNHIYSNLGYVLLGALFLGITAFRSRRVRSPPGRGIPTLHGLYYAMGAALVFEGVLSGCYHICPNQSNFQFDTSFMYVMAMLIMLKLYQNRHADMQASAYSAFTVLGLAVTVAMFGIIYNSLPVLVVFVAAYVVFCVYVALKLYFFARVARRVRTLAGAARAGNATLWEVVRPKRIKLFAFVLVALLLNFALAISGFFLYPASVDFGTYLLVILMGNAIMYCIFYTTMKIVSGERICFEAVLYGALALGFWAFGGYFFLNAATHWSQTPAQSRLLNKECMLLDFYDTHDVWHILSAPALFFTFTFLAALDDDLVDRRYEEIKVF